MHWPYLPGFLHFLLLPLSSTHLYPPLVFNSWIALQILTHVLRFFGGFQLVASSHDMEKYRRSVNQFTAILVISGMLWGLTGFMAARWGNNLHHLLILAVVTGLVGGSISTISPIFKAFMGFIIPATVLQSLSFYSAAMLPSWAANHSMRFSSAC